MSRASINHYKWVHSRLSSSVDFHSCDIKKMGLFSRVALSTQEEVHIQDVLCIWCAECLNEQEKCFISTASACFVNYVYGPYPRFTHERSVEIIRNGTDSRLGGDKLEFWGGTSLSWHLCCLLNEVAVTLGWN